MAIDDHSRVVLSLMLPAETAQRTCIHLLSVLRCYRGLGEHIKRMMTDNGTAERSQRFVSREHCLKLKHLHNTP